MNYNWMMSFTKNVSKHSDHKIKVGAVIVKKRPLAVGFNKCKTHPKYTNTVNKSIHAEVSALLSCKNTDITGSIIFVYRETKKGLNALARPCENCIKELKKRGVQGMFYTTSKDKLWKYEEL